MKDENTTNHRWKGTLELGRQLFFKSLNSLYQWQTSLKLKTDHEPVGAFQTFYGKDMINPLQYFYQNTKENAFIFQNYVLDIYQQRMEVLSAMEPMCKVIVMD